MLAIAVVGSTVLVALPTAMAPFTRLDVTPGQYSKPGLTRHPYVYVPLEELRFTIVAGANETYDAVVVRCDPGAFPACPPASASVLRGYDNQVIPPSGSLTLTYSIPSALADGTTYQIQIGNQNFIESNRTAGQIFSPTTPRYFAVQAYELTVEVDRPAYIGGDKVIVTWSANNLKGGSLAPSGFGQMWMYNENRTSLITPGVFTFDQASGSQTFTLPIFADPRFDGIVMVWFNDTPSNPIRYQLAYANTPLPSFEINLLGVLVDVTPNQYPPAGIVNVDVRTVVTNNQANPNFNDPPEPNIRVDITVWELTPAGPVARSQYAKSGLVTDTHGDLTYVFKLDANIADGTNFEVRANASHENGIWRWEAKDTFRVSTAAGITMILQFNQNDYQAGDTLQVTAIVSGTGGATLTYVYEVRDTTTTPCRATVADGTLLATSTRSENTFQYMIGQNFDGQVCVRVTADDGAGNRPQSAREFTVVFGWLLVNADRREYNPNDRVTISWELKSNRITSPTYFYEVRDSDGNLVTSGTADRNFQFPVPDPASDTYTFRVTATEAGRAVSGQITLAKVSGFFISVTFDRTSYAPGDTMRIQYRIVKRSGDENFPSTFTIQYGLFTNVGGGGLKVVSTARATGELTYTVPTGVNEGPQLFTVAEGRTGAQTFEVVTIRGTNPLWFVDVGDVPLLVLLMLLWLVVLTLMLWRRGALGMMAPKGPEAPEAPKPEEPVHAPPTSPMTVACRSCGSPIEITTSKRPIEVMCPKCGNTEMVA